MSLLIYLIYSIYSFYLSLLFNLILAFCCQLFLIFAAKPKIVQVPFLQSPAAQKHLPRHFPRHFPDWCSFKCIETSKACPGCQAMPKLKQSQNITTQVMQVKIKSWRGHAVAVSSVRKGMWWERRLLVPNANFDEFGRSYQDDWQYHQQKGPCMSLYQSFASRLQRSSPSGSAGALKTAMEYDGREGARHIFDTNVWWTNRLCSKEESQHAPKVVFSTFFNTDSSQLWAQNSASRLRSGSPAELFQVDQHTSGEASHSKSRPESDRLLARP